MMQLSTQFAAMHQPQAAPPPPAPAVRDTKAKEEPKKAEGVVVYVENDEDSSTDEEKSDNHNTSYEEFCVPGHADSGCVSDVSSNGNDTCILVRDIPDTRPDVPDMADHSDSSSQHSNGSVGLSQEFINFCRTFCSPAPSQGSVVSRPRRSPTTTTKLLKPLKDIPPRFQKMLSQNAVGKEQQFEGPPLVRQVAMTSRKNSSKSSSTSSSISEDGASYTFNPNAQAFTPSTSYEVVTSSYSPVYSQPESTVTIPTSDDYPAPYNVIMNGAPAYTIHIFGPNPACEVNADNSSTNMYANPVSVASTGTCYYPNGPVMGPPAPAHAPASSPQYMPCQYYSSHPHSYVPYPSPAPTTVVYSTPPQPYCQYPAPTGQTYTYTT